LKWSDLRYVFDIKEDLARKRYKPEEIVAKLRQVDVLLSQGQNIVDAIRQIGVSEVTYYRAPGVRRAENRAGEAPEGP
jgi:ACT domain-containing protein